MDVERDAHAIVLGEHCRVCGEKLHKAKTRSTSFPCTSHKDALKTAFNIDVDQDDTRQHPPHFCMSCYKKMKRTCTSREDAVPYTPTVHIFQWTLHTEEECLVSTDSIYKHTCTSRMLQVCQHFDALARGGRGKRLKGQGRPKGVTPMACINHIKEIAPDPLFTCGPDSSPTYMGRVQDSLKCTVCMDVLQSPIELPCNQLICSSCCIKSISTSRSTMCPCCYTYDLADSTPRKPPQVVLDLLAGLFHECTRCHTSVAASSYQAHLDTGCSAAPVQHHSPQNTP